MSISIATRDRRIIARWSKGERVVDIASRYGITPARVSQIIARVRRLGRR